MHGFYQCFSVDTLNKLKESLDKHYVEQVAKFEISKKHVLEERQKVFQDAFKGDLEVYKTLGTIPSKVHLLRFFIVNFLQRFLRGGFAKDAKRCYFRGDPAGFRSK